MLWTEAKAHDGASPARESRFYERVGVMSAKVCAQPGNTARH